MGGTRGKAERAAENDPATGKICRFFFVPSAQVVLERKL